MGLYIQGIDVGEIKRGAVACINVDDVVFFVGSDKIIPVPDHGDLIDRDELMMNMRETYSNPRVMFVWDIKNAPVVIPAERSEASLCDNCDEQNEKGCSWCKRMERSENESGV